MLFSIMILSIMILPNHDSVAAQMRLLVFLQEDARDLMTTRL
jgi:hypothetical protein